MRNQWKAKLRKNGKRMPYHTSFLMEKQVEEVNTISKFQEFQQKLVNKIYCEVFSCG